VQEIIYKADNDRNLKVEPWYGNDQVPGSGVITQTALGVTRTASGTSSTMWRCITYKDCLPVKWSKTVDKSTIQLVENMQVVCRTIKVSSYSGVFNPEA
jgi:hypothetical protein